MRREEELQIQHSRAEVVLDKALARMDCKVQVLEIPETGLPQVQGTQEIQVLDHKEVGEAHAIP
jgi:hypothetical protein